MDSVKRAQHRLSLYPQMLVKCSESATLYAKCVLQKEAQVGKNECGKEFQQLKNCMMNAAKNMKTKL